MIVYSKPGIVTVSVKLTDGYVFFDWKSFMIELEDLKKMHISALNAAKKYNCMHFIGNTSEVRTAMAFDLIDWFGKEWVPKLVTEGLKSVITIVPKSAIASMANKRWQREMVEGIAMVNVSDMYEALKVKASLT